MPGSYTIEQKFKSKEKVSEILSGMPAFMQQYADYCYGAKNSAPRTVLAYMYDHLVFLQFVADRNHCPLKSVTTEMIANLSVQDIQSYMAYLIAYTRDGEHFSNDASARARKISSLRGLYKWMISVNLASQNPALLVPTPKKEKKNIVRLENNEVREVLDGAETQNSLTANQKKHSQKHQLRDTAILTLLLHTGMRVSECVGIDYKDVDWEHSRIRIDRKGRKEAYIYINDVVYSALADYCDNERPENGDSLDDPLFISQKGGRMTVRAVEYLVKKYTVNVVDRKITPHKLRSTYATALYRQTGDIYKVAQVLGHESIDTTKRYADAGEQTLTDAAEDIRKAYK